MGEHAGVEERRVRLDRFVAADQVAGFPQRRGLGSRVPQW